MNHPKDDFGKEKLIKTTASPASSGFLCSPSCHQSNRGSTPGSIDLQSWKKGLKEALAYQKGRDLFAKCCKKNECEDNLLVWERKAKYKVLKKRGDREKEAVRIFEKYFCTTSGNEVSVSRKLMEPMRAALQSNITSDIFDDMQQELFDLMARDPFQRFLSHQMYTDLL